MPACDFAKTDQGFHQLVLAVARHSCDAENLAAPNLQADTVHRLGATVVTHVYVVDLQPHLGQVRLSAVSSQLNGAADHELGQLLVIRLCRPPLSNHLSTPDDGDAIRDLEHFMELVADEDDRAAVLR